MSEVHLYQTIYDSLRKEIAEGKYTVGMRLPTERELCERFDVSRITAKRALDMLADDGIVERAKGKGTYVVDCKPVYRQQKSSMSADMFIGVIIPDFSDAFGTKLLYGIEKGCGERGVNFLFRMTRGDYETEQRVISEMERIGIKGLLIAPVTEAIYNPKLLQLILKKFPIVIMDRSMPGVDACFVGTDNTASVKQAMDYLFDLGHKDIAWISPPIKHTTPLDLRQNAFIESHIEHNCLPDSKLWYNNIQAVRPGNATPDVIQQDLENLMAHLKAHPEITAVFASEYNVAWLIKQAAQTLGLRIPQDLSIVCFDLPNSFSQFREITYIRQDEEGIGRKAVQLLLERIEDADLPNETISFVGEFNIGRSTAPVRTGHVL